jgi:hypothetical protein
MTGTGNPGRFVLPCGEQGKLPAAKPFILPERDITHMSEQEKPVSFMETLDQWVDAEVIEKLYIVWSQAQDGNMDASSSSVKKAIQEKVLESYRNGLKAGAAKPKAQQPRRSK